MIPKCSKEKLSGCELEWTHTIEPIIRFWCCTLQVHCLNYLSHWSTENINTSKRFTVLFIPFHIMRLLHFPYIMII